MRSLDMGGEQHEASQEKLQSQEETDKTKSDLAASLSDSKDSAETSTNMLCGIEIENLTEEQKELFDRLNEAERGELSQRVSINKAVGQIEFTKAKLAIKDSDTATNVTKEEADKKVKELGDGWKLPGDVDFDDSNRLILDPAESEYDAMILEMPGKSDDEKVENFRLLTGMNQWYWTSQNYHMSSIGVISRKFDKNMWTRDRDGGHFKCHVRVVKPL